jgi:hypothetical protein
MYIHIGEGFNIVDILEKKKDKKIKLFISDTRKKKLTPVILYIAINFSTHLSISS